MRQLSLVLILSLFTACSPEKTPPLPVSQGIHGVWLTNVDSQVLFSREGIEEAVSFLASHGFNTIYPVVWNDAKTLYPSAVAEAYLGYRIDPRLAGRDPLQELLEAAHAAGLRVIPWFEYGFAASFKKDGGIILEKYPEWAAKDTSGLLLTKNGFEWLNAYHPGVQEFISKLVLEVVQNYDIDGVQGDDRLPAQPVEGGYSEYTQTLYAEMHQGQYPPLDPHDADFKRWRADLLNAFAARLYTRIKALKPDLVVSWAPSIYPWSYDEYLQDWPTWIKGGYADEVIPQNYRYSFQRYEATLAGLASDSLGLTPDQHRRITPGVLMNVGDYLIPQDYLGQIIESHRANAYSGEVFFFYEGLRKEHSRLGKYLHDSFYRTDLIP